MTYYYGYDGNYKYFTELPVCPLCGAIKSVYFKQKTDFMYVIACNTCNAEWMSQRKMISQEWYCKLIRLGYNNEGKEFLGQKPPLSFWSDLAKQRFQPEVDDTFIPIPTKNTTIKNDRYCPKCGRSIPFDADYCPYCGMKF